MSKKESVDVNVVGNQVVELLDRYQKLKLENQNLKAELTQTLADLDELKLKMAELNTKYNRLKLAKAYGWDEKSKREANNRISKLVRDIDECLGLLNMID